MRKHKRTFLNGDNLSNDGGNERVYVVGDIHGRLDLLDRMIKKIEWDLEENPVDDALTVTLGDYVDRGPESRGVLDRLACNPFPTTYIALKGNHEVLLEAFLRDPMVASQWRRFGGVETLHSYGVSISAIMIGKGFDEASDKFRKSIPEKHFQFLRSLKLSLPIGQYFLCHAGVRPGIPLEHQRTEDLLWIREEFMNSNISFGKIVVHGHTPVASPEVLPTRINIDTGAFATGRLTCLVLEGSGRRFLSTL
jgi:serine/threonine protein phosphatase 1